MDRALDRWMGALAWRRRAGRTVARLAPVLAISAFTAASAVITIRIAVPALAGVVPAIAAAGILAPLAWLPRAWGHRDPPALLAGHLDRLAGADGLAMALAAVPAGQRPIPWSQRLAPLLAGIRLPAIDLRPLVPGTLAGLCLAAAAILPQHLPPTTSERIPAPVRTLADRVGDLAERGLLSDEERAALQKQLAETAQAGLSQATWEGLDRLASSLDARSEAAQRRIEEALAAAETATATPPDARSDALAETATALAAALANLQMQAPGLVPQLSPDGDARELAAALMAAAERGELSPAQAKALAEALKKSGLAVKPGQCRDAAALARASAALLQALAQSQGKCQGGSCTSAVAIRCRNPAPSQGWCPPSPVEQEERDRLDGGHAQGLAQGERLNQDGSVTLATSNRAPEVDPTARLALARTAARAFDPLAADARTPAIAPRHRAAVEGYLAAGGIPAPVPTAGTVPTAPAGRDPVP